MGAAGAVPAGILVSRGWAGAVPDGTRVSRGWAGAVPDGTRVSRGWAGGVPDGTRVSRDWAGGVPDGTMVPRCGAAVVPFVILGSRWGAGCLAAGSSGSRCWPDAVTFLVCATCRAVGAAPSDAMLSGCGAARVRAPRRGLASGGVSLSECGPGRPALSGLCAMAANLGPPVPRRKRDIAAVLRGAHR